MVDNPEVGIPWLYKGLITWAFFWAFLDAYSIGANDVANAFANSVAARTITYRQACLLACIFELIGCVALGSAVTDTIKSKITNVSYFKNDPYVLALGMSTVNIGSGLWVVIATVLSMPVSTTHAVVGAVLGIGIAAWGTGGVIWSYEAKGFLQIVASWFISPCVSGALSAIFYLVTKFVILKNPDDVAARRGIALLPLYFFFVFGVIAGFMCMKGIPALKNTPYKVTVPVTVAIGIFFGLIGYIFCFTIPKGAYGYVTDQTATKDMESAVEGDVAMQQQYNGQAFGEPAQYAISGSAFGESEKGKGAEESVGSDSNDSALVKVLKYISPGMFMDIAELSEEDADMHSRAFQANPKTEELFKILQLSTCCFFSLAHGANDLANAVGPFATVWMVYSTGVVNSKADVPLWLLFYGGIALDIGLLTMGHQIMSALGNRLTLQSPSRGFNIELGAMFTVMVFSRLGIPVSTTHCISGATTGVGLCNGDVRSVNWKLLAVIFGGWIVTCPAAGIVTGLIFWAIISAPNPTPGNGFFEGHYHG
ncbi:hypothetical protein GUITHDRAFT_68795 [Guillardia theta CCMP2712]|uniref:Phosphate transporter n=1 Tax=Guillardia theta (strain CCMP2712) TaxID=905079 RepID=L1JJS0_GUITC|nr:hypothetical protein GUITHDRAFT_68795 [Guillardia theta CCMP2712]EKX48399.1 hypothetical protein GUITHDRAFT_68795 [Guillardia theta CCMP2712]|eukprot:XP_005835379.1 hypothetical protein GUITHDRAFT_68795 [Guillardia theta CCMP2712]